MPKSPDAPREGRATAGLGADWTGQHPVSWSMQMRQAAEGLVMGAAGYYRSSVQSTGSETWGRSVFP